MFFAFIAIDRSLNQIKMGHLLLPINGIESIPGRNPMDLKIKNHGQPTQTCTISLPLIRAITLLEEMSILMMAVHRYMTLSAHPITTTQIVIVGKHGMLLKEMLLELCFTWLFVMRAINQTNLI